MLKFYSGFSECDFSLYFSAAVGRQLWNVTNQDSVVLFCWHTCIALKKQQYWPLKQWRELARTYVHKTEEEKKAGWQLKKNKEDLGAKEKEKGEREIIVVRQVYKIMKKNRGVELVIQDLNLLLFFYFIFLSVSEFLCLPSTCDSRRNKITQFIFLLWTVSLRQTLRITPKFAFMHEYSNFWKLHLDRNNCLPLKNIASKTSCKLVCKPKVYFYF